MALRRRVRLWMQGASTISILLRISGQGCTHKQRGSLGALEDIVAILYSYLSISILEGPSSLGHYARYAMDTCTLYGHHEITKVCDYARLQLSSRTLQVNAQSSSKPR
jgi:hypothetical protein